MSTITLENLTDEGRRMWENILEYEKIAKTGSYSKIPKGKEIKLNPFEIQLVFLRDEIRRMIINSERVIADCDEILIAIEDRAEYLSSDAKVARMIHSNLVERFKKVLNYRPAFDEEIELEPENIVNKLFYDNFKNKRDT